MAHAFTSVQTLLPGREVGQGQPVLAVIAVVVFFCAALVLAAGADRPDRVVRWHSRFNRFHAQLLAGPDWEVPMRALTSKEYVDYLRDGWEHPERFPAYLATFRRSFTVAGLVVFALFVASVVLAIASL